MNKNCDKCRYYQWYNDYCYRWKCEVNGKSVMTCFTPYKTQETIQKELLNIEKDKEQAIEEAEKEIRI